MAYKQKGHYGKYSGNAKHSKHHMVNSWEEQDVKRGKQQMKEGHRGHAEALFDDAHGSYNYDGHNSTGSESPANFLGGVFGAAGKLVGRKGSRSRLRQHSEVMDALGRIEGELGGGESESLDPQQPIQNELPTPPSQTIAEGIASLGTAFSDNPSIDQSEIDTDL